MKILKIKLGLLSLLAVLFVSVFLTSCEQETLIPSVDTLELVSEENPNDMNIAENTETGELLLEAHFDADMTAEEADEQWEEMVNDYVSSLDTKQLKNRGSSSKWKYYLKIYTDSNPTSGPVAVRMNFSTNRGTTTSNWTSLPNAGKNGWHYYLRTQYSSQVNRVKINWAEIAMRGTDSWKVKHIYAYLYKNQQPVSASGFSYLEATPNVVLDSSTSSAWDFYKALGGAGYIYF